MSGEFTLQATLDGAEHMVSDLVHCRRQAQTREISDQATGEGGLLILRDKHNALRLFAHIQEPGEVLCEIRQEEQRWILGHGLLEEGPLHLRIERKGTRIHVYAGNEEGTWYLCGEIDLPGWDRVEVGVYGEAPVDLYSIVKQTETRFCEVGLDASGLSHDPILEEDPLYLCPDRHPMVDFPEIIAEGSTMRRVRKQVRRAAIAERFMPYIRGVKGGGCHPAGLRRARWIV